MAPFQSRLVPAALEGPVHRAVRSLFGTSWGKARGWIEAGKVRVGGALVTEPTTRVVAGAEIAVDEAARKPHAQELADGDVVYADTQVVVVAKPPGLSTIPYDGTESDTLEARVRAWLERKGLVPRGQRPTLGIVHRLDKETSGLVVFTRTWLAKQALSSQFRHHTVPTSRSRTATCRRARFGAFSWRTGATAFEAPGAARAASSATDERAITRVARIERSALPRSSPAGSRPAALTRFVSMRESGNPSKSGV